MSKIDVTCPGCMKRFQVSDKFAGKSGPCPQCKTVIKIPSLKEQVVIHEPEAAGPKDSTGKAIIQPIFREEPRISQPLIIAICGAVALILIAALTLRIGMGLGPKVAAPLLPMIIGSLALAPPLVMAGYALLRDDELAPYRDRELYQRLIPCSVGYPLLWVVYWGVFAYLGWRPDYLEMAIALPLMVIAGAVIAQASLGLEFTSCLMHYGIYLGATVLLRVLMNLDPFWHLPGK